MPGSPHPSPAGERMAYTRGPGCVRARRCARRAGSCAEPRLRESALRQPLAGALNPAPNSLAGSSVDPVFTGAVGNGKSGLWSGLLGTESLTQLSLQTAWTPAGA